MSNGSNPHSITPSKPVDPSTIRVLRAVNHVASALNCPFFVAGATARDLMLVNVYGLRPGRATRDIDFGIAVESWDEFQGLKERMIATGQFAEIGARFDVGERLRPPAWARHPRYRLRDCGRKLGRISRIERTNDRDWSVCRDRRAI